MHRLFQEVLPMCRRNQLLGVLVAGIGVGLLLACLFDSGFFCSCVGIGLIAAGVVILQKR